MEKEKSTLISKVISQIIGSLTVGFLVTYLFVRIFYWNELIILGDRLTSIFSFLIYSFGALLFGSVSVLHYREIYKGEKKGVYSICTMFILILGFIFCFVKLFFRFGGNL